MTAPLRRHTDAVDAAQRASVEGTRIDLDAFLALSSDDRAIRWRQWSLSAKQDVVIQQLTKLGYAWSNELVAAQVAKYDAKYALGPVEAAVEGALERLAFDNAQHAENADKTERAYFRRHATAYANALAQYRAGVRPQLLASGAWLIPSSTPGKPAHIVRMSDGDWLCSCCAGRSMHWPVALIVAQEVAQDDMQDFDDGAPDSELAGAIERTNEVIERMQATQRLAARICAARGRSQWAA